MADAEKPHVKMDCAGQGALTIVFVHGGACGRSDWRFQMNALAPRFRVIAVDLPGHGESDLPSAATVAGLADAVSAIVSHASGKVVLVGHSLGCRVILDSFRHAPSSVSALIFVDGSLSAGEGDLLPIANAQKLLDEMGMDAFLNFSFRQMFVDGSDPRIVEQFVSRARHWNAQLARSVLLDAIRFDACDTPQILPGIDVPVLLIQSSYVDETFRRVSLRPGAQTPWTELVARTIPHHELHVVENVGHFPHLEAPNAVNAHIASFLEHAVAKEFA